MTSPKILVFDIENAPYLTWNWDLWNQNAIDIEQEWFLLSFAWGWYDMNEQRVKGVKVKGLIDGPKYKPGDIDDKWLAHLLWPLLDEADIVAGQNSDKFDIRKVNEKFLVHKMGPPAPYQTIDTKRIYQKHFSGSAAMKYMTRKMGLEQKTDAGGWPLWKGCINGDLKAWRKMKAYNKDDVFRTAEMYTELLPWLGYQGPAGPNMGHYVSAVGHVCPNCGNKDKDEGGLGFQRRGYRHTAAYSYPRFQCKRCGKYSRAWKSEPNTRTLLR